MNITVILCTYNRCQSLAKALDSIAAQALPDSVEWELVVVDNNSTDRTREVVNKYCRRHPARVRYIFEPQQGLSNARNAGVREARGEIVAFLDDDVTVERTWLRNLTAALGNGEWAGAGGRIVLAQPFSPPRWLSLQEPYNLGGALCALFDLGDKPGKLDRAPYGANMAFRRVMFEKYGRFRTDLGRSPGSLMSNEDTEFGRRLIAAGEQLRYEPSATAYHPAPVNRIQEAYFLTWWFNYGRARVREWRRGPDVLGIPRPYLNILKTVMVTMGQRVQRWILASDPQRRFYCKCQVWMTTGEIRELYRMTQLEDTEGADNA